MTPARRGEWWQSAKGAIYCVDGAGFGKRGLGASVTLWWLTGHTPPQVHRIHLYPKQWAALTRNGTRIDGPPSHNHNGASLADAARRVREMLAAP